VSPTVPLGDVATFVRGVTFKPADVTEVGRNGSIACLRTKNVQAEIDLSDVWGIPESIVKNRAQYLQAGDTLVSSANSWNLVGKCCWVPALPWPASFGGFVAVLRGDSARVDPRYLFRWFSSPNVQATVRSFGRQTTNIANLDIGRCLKLPLPLPPLVEQRRVAAILDQADALRTKRRAALAQLDALAESIFIDMFGDPATNPKGWPIIPLRDCAKEIQIGPFGSLLHESDYVRGGVPLVNPKHIKNGIIDADPDESVVPRKLAKLNAYVLHAGDVVMGRRGEMGRCAVVRQQDAGFLCGTGSLFIRPDPLVLAPIYVAAWLSAPSTRRQLERAALGATLPNLNRSIVASLAIPLPPLGLQVSFGKTRDRQDALTASGRSALRLVDDLIASIQHSELEAQ
jgi:type I restriction enzyme S subunit